MGIVVYSLLWVMQDLYHQQYRCAKKANNLNETPNRCGFGEQLLLGGQQQALVVFPQVPQQKGASGSLNLTV